MNKDKKSRRILLGCAAVVLALWHVWGNTALEVDRYTISDGRIPKAFSGFRIAHVSDLHNAFPGRKSHLLEALKNAGPDIIVITGDLVDSRRPDPQRTFDFVREIRELAPVYYVSGNHESRQDYASIREGVQAAGAVVLDDEKCWLERDGQTISLLGLSDPAFSSVEALEAALADLMEGEQDYSVLLCHRPELFDLYHKHGACLAFSGHAHGGQVRIPGIGGLFAPHQGFFPEYHDGLYQRDGTTMLVSRGLGDSTGLLRVNDRHTLVIAELRSAKTDDHCVNKQ